MNRNPCKTGPTSGVGGGRRAPGTCGCPQRPVPARPPVPAPPGRGRKRGGGGRSLSPAAGAAPGPPLRPAKPLLRELNTRTIPSRACRAGSACRSRSPLAAGRRPAPPATSRVEPRGGGVRARPTPRGRRMRAGPAGGFPAPPRLGGGVPRRTRVRGPRSGTSSAAGESEGDTARQRLWGRRRSSRPSPGTRGRL